MKWISESLGVLTGVGIVAVGAMVWPDMPFMTVHDMHVTGEDVIATRTISAEKTIADWRVTVVKQNEASPICNTIAGPELHEGWSVYSQKVRGEYVNHLDIWINDPGCYDRLVNGKYDMFVTWTPRDGTAPVSARTEFAVSK